jgi:hypothetical protein
MRTANSTLTGTVIERILELSADAQIKRRNATNDSREFHDLTGAIRAYGKALELLVGFRKEEELYALLCEISLPENASELLH